MTHTYQRILAAENDIAALYGRGSELHRAGRALLRREAWEYVQRENLPELQILVGALFDALLGWTR